MISKHLDLCYLGNPLAGDVLDMEVAILELDDALFARALPGLQREFLSVIARCSESGRNVLLAREGFLRPTRYQGHDLKRTTTHPDCYLQRTAIAACVRCAKRLYGALHCASEQTRGLSRAPATFSRPGRKLR